MVSQCWRDPSPLELYVGHAFSTHIRDDHVSLSSSQLTIYSKLTADYCVTTRNGAVPTSSGCLIGLD